MGYLNDYYSGTGTKKTTSSSSGGYLQQYRTQQKNVKVTDNKKTTTSKKTPTKSKKIGDYFFSFKQPDYRTGYQKYQDILGIAKGTTDYGGALPKQEDQIVVQPKQKKLTDSQMRTLNLLNQGEDRLAGQSAGLTLASQQAITDYYKPENLNKERERIRAEIQASSRPLPSDYREPGTIGYAIDAIKLGTVGLASSVGANIEMFGNMSELVGLTKVGQKLQKEADTVIAQNPEWQPDPNEKWGGKKVARLVAGAVPSLLTVVATTLLTGGLAGVAVAFSLEGGSAYKESVESGVEEKQAQRNGLVVGSINAMLERIFPSSLRKGGGEAVEQISKSLYKNIKDQAIKFGVRFTKNGFLEGSTEATQQVVANAVATSYDKDRKLWDGMLESFVGGFGSAGLIGAVTDATTGENKEEAQARLKKEIQEGEQDPDAVIGQVIASGLENTPEGKKIIKFALEAKQEGSTIEIQEETPTEEQVRDLNRPQNEENSQKIIDNVIKGNKEDQRLDNADQLNIAKKYTANSLGKNATPDTTVTIYRATTDEKLGTNVFVTLDKANAERIAGQREGSQVVTAKAQLRDLVFSGGLKSEFIYAPKQNVQTIPSVDRAKDYTSAQDFAEEVFGATPSQRIGLMNPDNITIRDEVGYGTEEYNKLKEDIRKNGIKEPIRVTLEDGKLVTTDGSQRTAIAQELGIKVPTIVNEGEVEGLQTIEDIYKETQEKEEKIEKPPRKRNEIDREREIADYVDSKGVKLRKKSQEALILAKEDDAKLTSRYLETQAIKNRKTASYQYLMDYSKSNSLGLKAPEIEAIQQTLQNNYKPGDTIDMEEFRSLLIGNLMPLDAIRTSTYANYGSDNIGLYDAETTTYILNSPFNHGITGHFSGDFEFSLDKTDIEIKEIPPQQQNPTAKYAVVRKGVSLTEENIEENVFHLDRTKEGAEKWVNDRTFSVDDKRKVRINTKGLFAHFRSFDLKDVKTFQAPDETGNIAHIAELQSDVYQQNKIGKTAGIEKLRNSIAKSEEDLKLVPKQKAKYKKAIKAIEEGKLDDYPRLEMTEREDFLEKLGLDYATIQYKYVADTEATPMQLDRTATIERFNEIIVNLDERKAIIQRDIDDERKQLEDLEKTATDLEKQFLSYKNTWYERAVREAINIKAKEGFDLIRFPTPRTVAIIEGFVGDGENAIPYEIIEGEQEQLKAGDKIEYGGTPMTVVSADQYSIRVAEADNVQDFLLSDYYEEEIDSKMEDLKYNYENDTVGTWGEIKTPEDAQKALNSDTLLVSWGEYHAIDKDVEQQEKWRANSSDLQDAIRSRITMQKTVDEYKKFKELLENDVVKKEKLTKTNLKSPIFKKKLEDKYGLDYGYWNHFLNEWEVGNTTAEATKNILDLANTTIPRYQERVAQLTEEVDKLNKQYDDKIAEIKARELPEVDGKKMSLTNNGGISKELLTEYQEKKFYGLDYEQKQLLEGIADEKYGEEFDFDDSEYDIREELFADYDPNLEDIYSEVYFEDEGNDQRVYVVTEGYSESFQQPDEYDLASSVEDFDIDDFDTEQKTVLQFYDRKIIKYLEKLRKDNLELITDEQGNQWYETKTTKQDLRPPTAYRLKDDLAKVGITVTDEQEQKIIKLNKQIFGDTNVKVIGQILANDEALGSYEKNIIRILDKQAKPEETFYHEAVHKYLDVFTDRSEYIAILKEAQDKYQVNDLAEVEERLAEDFIKYVNDRRSVGGRLRQFFDMFLNRLKKYFGSQDKIENLYSEIITGKAKKKKAYRAKAVPREQLPVKTKGKKKVSRLEARVKKVLEKASPEQVEELGLAKYNEMNKEENIAEAVAFVEKNPQLALEVLAGQQQAPKGILVNSIYIAMERRAEGDIELARRLASLRSTRLGQEISILTELDPDSAVRYMKDVIRVREEVFGKRYKKRSEKQVIESTVKSIKKSIKKPNKKQWNGFLEEIKC